MVKIYIMIFLAIQEAILILTVNYNIIMKII